MELEVEDERFLGSQVKSFTGKVDEVKTRLDQHPTKHLRPHLTKEGCNGYIPKWTYDVNPKLRGKVYDMTEFVDLCMDRCRKLACTDKRELPKASTPCLDESNDPHCVGILVNDLDARNDDVSKK